MNTTIRLAAPTRRLFLQWAGRLLLTIGPVARRVEPVAAQSFDIFEKSIRDLQAAMAAGQLTSVQLVQFYLDRIAAYDQAGPRLNAVLSCQCQRLGRCARAGRGAKEARRARPAARHSGAAQGQLRDERHADDRRRRWRLSGSVPKAGCLPGPEAAPGRRRDPRQGEPSRARTWPDDRQLARRSDAEPVRPDAGARRLERRLRRRGRRELRRVRDGDRHERFHSHPQLAQLHRRPAAIALVFRAAPASSRSATRRTPAGRWRERSRTSRLVLDATVGYDPADPVTAASRRQDPAHLHVRH